MEQHDRLILYARINRRDCARDAWFIAHEWFVMRFTDDEIITTLQEVLDTIHAALERPGEVIARLNDAKPHRWCTRLH